MVSQQYLIMSNFQELYKKETGINAIDKIQLYAGDRGGPEVFTDEYVEWLEKRLALQEEIVENNGCIRVELFPPKNNEEILTIFNDKVIYIGDDEVLTKMGEIQKIIYYKQIKNK
jgi:hypothetical protein